MDCFAELPPEIRVGIMARMSNKTVSRLISASPAMLAQYIESKKSIMQALLISLLDGGLQGDLLRDALGIIHMPVNSSSTTSVLHHVEQWATNTFTDPFEQPDVSTLDKLYRLFSRLSIFIEDYLTKATAPFPPRAYLCLPRVTSWKCELYFKDKVIDMHHVTMDGLKLSERNRLLRAFVRYELLCKFYVLEVWDIVCSSQYAAKVKQSHSNLDIWEYESLHCVSEYAQCLYAAIFANFTASWLPNDPSASGEKEFIYPDNLCVSPLEYICNLDMPRSCYHAAVKLHLRGFDVLAHLLVYSGRKPGNYAYI